MLRESTLEYLSTRVAKLGETVQFGWLVFRVTENEGKMDVETLDFKSIGSFTNDFEIAERIHWAQHETLRRVGEPEAPCTLLDAALVSRSYHPGDANAFIERQSPTSDADCGWYVGVADDNADFSNADSFEHKSLYELTIRDERFARFWLLPVGYRVLFNGDEPRIELSDNLA